MSMFTNGQWHFRAAVDPTKKKFEVTYKDRQDIGRRQTFHTEEEANRFADVTGGKVTPVAVGRKPVTC